MSSLANAMVTYEEFLRLPDPEEGHRYELHDGEVVLVPPARPVHLALQMRIQELLRFVEDFRHDRGDGISVQAWPELSVLVCRCRRIASFRPARDTQLARLQAVCATPGC